MTTHSQPFAPLVLIAESVALTPAEQAAKAQTKVAKKERKYARLRWFFSWCWGCQWMGGSF
ncbi:hypothetical protein [Hymenobacter coccineus]|uniref:hypothetical protein n=1 Tax=Hymenobacter coccineus TaxID=1908235 RepID=UPI0008A5AB6F|nr:hypothetical protein [Hymenobacter coccineus]